MTDRIASTFSALKASGRKGLVGYLTAGDPDLENSERDIRIALENGVDVLELGVPFSDPTSDGPTIQAAAHRSLAAGTTLSKVLELVRRLRKDFDAPIVLFGYTNPFFRYGYERVCDNAAEVGVDGMLVVDLPFEEAGEMGQFLKASGLRLVPLIAPTTPRARAKEILSHDGGFVYYIMVTGVTGARTQVAAGVAEHVAPLRAFTDLPIAVGFGISNGDQARQVGRAADAVVVGSALVNAAREGKLAELVRDVRRGLDAKG